MSVTCYLEAQAGIRLLYANNIPIHQVRVEEGEEIEQNKLYKIQIGNYDSELNSL